jgi:hypothetical protein
MVFFLTDQSGSGGSTWSGKRAGQKEDLASTRVKPRSPGSRRWNTPDAPGLAIRRCRPRKDIVRNLTKLMSPMGDILKLKPGEFFVTPRNIDALGRGLATFPGLNPAARDQAVVPGRASRAVLSPDLACVSKPRQPGRPKRIGGRPWHRQFANPSAWIMYPQLQGFLKLEMAQ